MEKKLSRTAAQHSIAVENLEAVTSAEDGAAVDMGWYKMLSVFIEVSGNTGAVTVKIESSPTGEYAGEEVLLDEKTYTAENDKDQFSYQDHFPFLRTTTTDQTNSTVTTVITGRT